MAKKITEDMVINDIIQVDKGLIPILMSAGMQCVGCPSAQSETFAEACVVHGMEPTKLLNEMNEYLDNK